MKEEWFTRLEDAIRDSGDSMRAISLRAGLSDTYVHHMIKYGKAPSVTNFIKICDAVPVDPVEVLTGFKQDAYASRVLRLFSAMPESQRRAFLEYLASVQTENEQDGQEQRNRQGV